MSTTPFAALSIHHFVNSVGADAGFAAIIGLAVMVLLFFSQARETATLRRRADEAEERLRQLAAYVEHVGRQRAAAPAPAPAAAAGVAPAPAAARIAARPAAFPGGTRPAPAPAPAVAAAALATLPVAPAGVGAPALSSATRLIPLAEPDEISIRALNNGEGEHAVAVTAPPATPEPPPAGPPPSTAAAAANGTSNGVAHATAPPTEPPPPRVALRPDASGAGEPPARPVGPPQFRDPVPPRRRGVSRFGIAIIAVVGVVIAVVAVLVVLNSGSGGSARNPTAPAGASSKTAATSGKHGRKGSTIVKITPEHVTVAVLNGTNTYHLAADVLGKLTAVGYKAGPTQNAPSQTLTSTTVGYTQPAYRADALAVAQSLKLAPSTVQSVTQSDLSAACGTTATCPAQVVVTVGSDLNSDASST